MFDLETAVADEGIARGMPIPDLQIEETMFRGIVRLLSELGESTLLKPNWH